MPYPSDVAANAMEVIINRSTLTRLTKYFMGS